MSRRSIWLSALVTIAIFVVGCGSASRDEEEDPPAVDAVVQQAAEGPTGELLLWHGYEGVKPTHVQGQQAVLFQCDYRCGLRAEFAYTDWAGERVLALQDEVNINDTPVVIICTVPDEHQVFEGKTGSERRNLLKAVSTLVRYYWESGDLPFSAEYYNATWLCDTV